MPYWSQGFPLLGHTACWLASNDIISCLIWLADLWGQNYLYIGAYSTSLHCRWTEGGVVFSYHYYRYAARFQVNPATTMRWPNAHTISVGCRRRWANIESHWVCWAPVINVVLFIWSRHTLAYSLPCVAYSLPCVHKTVNQCWFNVGPAS